MAEREVQRTRLPAYQQHGRCTDTQPIAKSLHLFAIAESYQVMSYQVMSSLVLWIELVHKAGYCALHCTQVSQTCSSFSGMRQSSWLVKPATPSAKFIVAA
jgi:hypothetical protein